jgi:hypothetical protein
VAASASAAARGERDDVLSEWACSGAKRIFIGGFAGNNAFMAGAHASLVISAAVLLAGAVAIWHGRAKEGR